jgi:hypothetical protein
MSIVTAADGPVQQAGLSPKVFFTYVWGPTGNPAWPLTFSSKAARSHAVYSLSEGDFVFTVCTKDEPTLPEYRGRVVGVYQVSDFEVNTQDYDLPLDNAQRFPFALHPIAVWQITPADNIFAAIVGPLTPTHHLQAQTTVVELDSKSALPLLSLAKTQVAPMPPNTELGKGLVARINSKLAPKHQGDFVGAFAEHDVWYVYLLALKDQRNKALAIKVGYSNEPYDRVQAFNRAIAPEVTGLKWVLEFKQPTSSEDPARHLEQAVLSHFSSHKLSSNGEIIAQLEPIRVIQTIATLMRP